MAKLQSGDILAFVKKGRFHAVASHVAIVCNVWGKPVVYEATFESRPPDIRSNTKEPSGGQAHYPEDMLKLGYDVWHLPLWSTLYEHEEDRLLTIVDHWIGRSITDTGLVIAGLKGIGRLPKWRLPIWSPGRLVSFVRRAGVVSGPVLLS